MDGLTLRTNVPALDALQNVEARTSSLHDDVTQLSSGLRINSAADDPSGLAIATSLQSRAQGYQAATGNVQTAQNATVVAEQALGTITSVLQRIRSIAVQAASTVTSDADRQNLQVEVDSLIHEINTVVRNTTFNGNQLIGGANGITLTFNGTTGSGSFTISGPPVGDASFEQLVVAGYQYDPTGLPWQFSGQSGISTNGSTLTASNPDAPNGYQVAIVEQTGSIQQGVAGFSAGVAYQISFDAANRVSSPGGKTQTIQLTIDGSVIGTFTPSTANYQQYLSSVFAPGGGTHVLGISGLDPYGDDETAFVDNMQIFANASPQNAQTNFSVNDGGTEGTQLLLVLPDARALTLGVATVNVTTFTAAETAIGQLDGALQIIAQQRAQLGAQNVALGDDAANASLAIVNLNASQSSIRDANVGQAVTDLTRNEILVQVGAAVVGQAQVDQSMLLDLFAQSALPITARANQLPAVTQAAVQQAAAPAAQSAPQSPPARANSASGSTDALTG